MAVKVLMFGWEFPPHNSGGLGVACKGLVNALSSDGLQITFVLPRRVDTEKTGARMVFADVKHVDVVEVESRLLPYVTPEEYERAWSHSENDKVYGNTLLEEIVRYGKKGREIALREDFEIIHAHDWLSFLAGIEAKRATGKPLVVHVHATEWDRSGGKMNPQAYDIERQGLEEADCIVAVSGWTKKIIIEHYGIAEEKIEVVHNGVEAFEGASAVPQIKTFKDAGYKTVLFVGRLTIQKGPDYFVQLAKRVTDLRPKTLFLMSGSGDMEAQVMRQAAALGISDKILFTGFLRGAELHTVYAAADLFVMPSVSEPFGITPLESILNGTPVLISKQSGVAEVLPHSLKADFWDVDDMADKVYSVLEHESLHKTLRVNGERNVLSITWQSAAQKCMKVYHKILDSVKQFQKYV